MKDPRDGLDLNRMRQEQKPAQPGESDFIFYEQFRQKPGIPGMEKQAGQVIGQSVLTKKLPQGPVNGVAHGPKVGLLQLSPKTEGEFGFSEKGVFNDVGPVVQDELSG